MKHFQRGGRGVFSCSVCGRNTRNTGDSERTCGQCFDIAGFENSIVDNGFEPGTPEHDAIKAECEALLEDAVRRGGSTEKIREANNYVWPIAT